MEMTAAQLRAARALLGWSQERLAKEAIVGVATVRRFEAGMSQTMGALQMSALRQALERAGISFLGKEGLIMQETDAVLRAARYLVAVGKVYSPDDSDEEKKAWRLRIHHIVNSELPEARTTHNGLDPLLRALEEKSVNILSERVISLMRDVIVMPEITV